MKEELGNREFNNGGIAAIVRSCQCIACKNYFWVPSNGSIGSVTPLPEYLLPNFCPFCGGTFDHEKQTLPMDDDDVAVMQDLLRPDSADLDSDGEAGPL